MSELLEFSAAVLFACRLGLFAALHVWPGGIHLFRNAVSDYATSSSPLTRKLSVCSSWTAAAAWLALGAGLLLDPRWESQPVAPAIWLIILGVILATMPWVPTDGPGVRPTFRGRLHMLLAVGWFTISYSTMGPLAGLLDLAGIPALAETLSVSRIVAAIALAALVLSMLIRPLRSRTFGVSERIFILAVTFAPLLASAGLAAH
ncbi:DUF998 domain-containing protein [Specibacter sp. AOP5-B1-6]|uniref:DUF998 domain-containing protein n=1 Tax=Specibacter sp. AOP5-B1-6 TaxID=3457653 RepID=UPI00402B8DF5